MADVVQIKIVLDYDCPTFKRFFKYNGAGFPVVGRVEGEARNTTYERIGVKERQFGRV